MAGHEILLDQISIKGDVKQSLLTTAKGNYDALKNDLIDALDSHQYTEGKDGLSLNQRLLETLGVTLSVESLKDLNVFKTLSPKDIHEVLQNVLLRAQVIQQMRTLDNFVIFCMEMPPEN